MPSNDNAGNSVERKQRTSVWLARRLASGKWVEGDYIFKPRQPVEPAGEVRAWWFGQYLIGMDAHGCMSCNCPDAVENHNSECKHVAWFKFAGFLPSEAEIEQAVANRYGQCLIAIAATIADLQTKIQQQGEELARAEGNAHSVSEMIREWQVKAEANSEPVVAPVTFGEELEPPPPPEWVKGDHIIVQGKKAVFDRIETHHTAGDTVVYRQGRKYFQIAASEVQTAPVNGKEPAYASP